nr:subtilisin-like protease SBT1.4 [Ipomoea batatas]
MKTRLPFLVVGMGRAEDHDVTQQLVSQAKWNTIALFLRDGPPVDCSTRNLDNPGTLNYPSFSVVFNNNNPQTVTYKRTVKNVGTVKNVVYTAQGNISPLNAVNVNVSPSKLEFSERNNILSYEVTFTSITPTNAGAFGSLVWSDGTHIVSSPIAVMWQGAALQSEL